MSGFSSMFGSPPLPVVSLDPSSNAYPAGRHLGDGAGLSHVDTDLVAANIALGTTIFGVIGTMVSWVYDVMKRLGKGALTVPITTLQVSTTENHSGGAHNQSKAVAVPVPLLAMSPAQATSQPVDGAVAHEQTGAVDTDETTETNNATVDDMDLLPATGNSTGDGFYFGLASAWEGLVLNVSTPGVGNYTIAWKYWNGSAWVAIPLISFDTTNHFKTAGRVNLKFTPPIDWATTDIASIADLYWIKAEVTFTNMTTQPKGSQAWIQNYSM